MRTCSVYYHGSFFSVSVIIHHLWINLARRGSKRVWYCLSSQQYPLEYKYNNNLQTYRFSNTTIQRARSTVIYTLQVQHGIVISIKLTQQKLNYTLSLFVLILCYNLPVYTTQFVYLSPTSPTCPFSLHYLLIHAMHIFGKSPPPPPSPHPPHPLHQSAGWRYKFFAGSKF